MYIPSYSHIGNSSLEDVELVFDVCETLDFAQNVLDEWKPRFINALDEEFNIDEWTINQLEWQEGFD